MLAFEALAGWRLTNVPVRRTRTLAAGTLPHPCLSRRSLPLRTLCGSRLRHDDPLVKGATRPRARLHGRSVSTYPFPFVAASSCWPSRATRWRNVKARPEQPVQPHCRLIGTACRARHAVQRRGSTSITLAVSFRLAPTSPSLHTRTPPSPPPAPTPLPRRDADFIGCLETPRACGEGDGPCDGPCTRRWPMGATVGWDGAWRPPRRAASRDGCMRSLRLGWLAARTIFSNLTEATAEPASYRYWRASEGGLLVLSIRSGCLDPFSLSISCGADAQRRATLIPVRPTQDGIVNQGPSLAVRAPPCPSEGG